MICLLVITDGRQACLEQTVAATKAMLDGPITRALIYDDSGDSQYRAWLRKQYPAFEIVYHPKGRQGFAGAIQTAWRFAELGPDRFIFHLEDDFVIERPVDLWSMMSVLDDHPHLVQLALRRQPWNDEERAAGGIVESHPEAYTEHSAGISEWLEHRLFFTTNPSLYRRSLCSQPWPDGANSEGRFSHQLLVDPDVRFGFWGGRDSGEWVTHIGNERVGVGY